MMDSVFEQIMSDYDVPWPPPPDINDPSWPKRYCSSNATWKDNIGAEIRRKWSTFTEVERLLIYALNESRANHNCEDW